MSEKALLEWLLKNEQMRGPRSRFGRRGKLWGPEFEREAARWLRSSSGFKQMASKIEGARLTGLDARFEAWLAGQEKK